MSVIWSTMALIGDDWHNNVRIDIDAGRISAIAPDAPRDPAAVTVGCVVPAPVNCHSHAFQRAMAGLTERRGAAGQDSFWTWRQLMYRFLDQLTPEQVEAIAAQVQVEMLEAGYGASVEFHYLHHQPDGTPYDDIGEMAQRILAAAASTGIGLTLLPVMYQFGGCDRRPLGAGQRRFGNDPESFVALVASAGAGMGDLPPDCRLGVAPHSLRAVAPEDLGGLAKLAPDGPIHMHLAEQLAEVDEVSAAWGARPVEWAIDNIDLSARWCLIHCTQMTAAETVNLARTGAIAGLCPLTEASLGDGIFDGMRWAEAGGAMAVGSDSNIRISLAEELRQLDTSQRLRDHSRAAFATAERSTGRALLQAVAAGGAVSAARGTGRLEVGAVADILALNSTHPDLFGVTGDTLLDTFIFAGDSGMVSDVWSAGRHLVRDGRHIDRARILAAYGRAVAALRAGV